MARRNTPLIDQLFDKWWPNLAAAFQSSIDRITGRVRQSDVIRELERNNVEGALDALDIDPLDFQDLSINFRNSYEDMGILRADELPSRVRVVFNVRDPQAEAWISQRSSNLIVGISNDQRQAIRQYLERGLQGGRNPRETARVLVGSIDKSTGLRTGGIIGLTTRQEAAQDNYARLIASRDPSDLRLALQRGLRNKRFDRSVQKAIRDGKPIPAETQARMRVAYRNRMLKYRGDSIARTETLQSLGASEYETFRQAIARGEVDARQVTKIWQSAGDGRVRNSHAILNGQKQLFVQPFISPLGSRLMFPGDISLGARAADVIQCRCRAEYKIDFKL